MTYPIDPFRGYDQWLTTNPAEDYDDSDPVEEATAFLDEHNPANTQEPERTYTLAEFTEACEVIQALLDHIDTL